MYNKELLADVFRRYEYPDFIVDSIIDRLNNMQPEIKDLFDRWLLNNSVPDVEINGYTFKELIGNTYCFTPINAFLTLNWLLIDPDNANAALEGGIR